MKTKTLNIIKHLHAKGKVVIDMDGAFGHRELILTNSRDGYIIGTAKPQGISVHVSRESLIIALDANSIYINGWK